MAVQLDGDWSALSPQEIIRLKEELRVTRELRGQPSEGRLPYIPHFSGDDGVKLDHYLSAIRSLRGFSESAIAQAIRKSVKGTAARIIENVDYTTTKDELVDLLKTYFDDVAEKSSAWQIFYGATQAKTESLVEWRSRLLRLYNNTGSTMDDSILKSKLYDGLHSQRLRDLTAWKYEDDTATEADLFKLLRKSTERITVGATCSTTTDPEVKALRAQVEQLTAQVASLTTNPKTTKSKTNKQDTDHKKDDQPRRWNNAGKRSNYRNQRSTSRERQHSNTRRTQWRRSSPSRDYHHKPEYSRGRQYYRRSDSRHDTDSRRPDSRKRSSSNTRRTPPRYRRQQSQYRRRSDSRRRHNSRRRTPSYDRSYRRHQSRYRSSSRSRDRNAHKQDAKNAKSENSLKY